MVVYECEIEWGWCGRVLIYVSIKTTSSVAKSIMGGSRDKETRVEVFP